MRAAGSIGTAARPRSRGGASSFRSMVARKGLPYALIAPATAVILGVLGWPLLFLLYPPKYIGQFYWIIAAALYALAKLLEFSDDAVYSVGSILSGHTLKHLAAAAACFAVLRYFQTRRPIT